MSGGYETMVSDHTVGGYVFLIALHCAPDVGQTVGDIGHDEVSVLLHQCFGAAAPLSDFMCHSRAQSKAYFCIGLALL